MVILLIFLIIYGQFFCGCLNYGNEMRDEYFAAMASISYNKTDETISYQVIEIFKNISYAYSQFDDDDSILFDFDFYHRIGGDEDKIDYNHSIDCGYRTIYNGVVLEFSGLNKYELDNEILEQNVKFMTDLLEKILGRPNKILYYSIPGGYD